MNKRTLPRKPVRRRPRQVVLRSKVKQERRQHVVRTGGILLIVGGLIFGGWWGWTAVNRFLTTSPSFTIAEIDVRGGVNVSRSEILAMLPVRPGDNMFQFSAAETERNIGSCKPELKHISVGRRWHRVVVSLEERVPVACVTVNGERQGLDAGNTLFPLRGELTKRQFPEIVAGTDAERAELLKFIAQFAPAAQDLFKQVAKLYPEPVNDVILELADQTRIYWGPIDRDSIGPKLKRLKQVLADGRSRFQSLEYVNMAFYDDGRILVRPRNAQAVQAMAREDRVIMLASVQ